MSSGWVKNSINAPKEVFKDILDKNNTVNFNVLIEMPANIEATEHVEYDSLCAMYTCLMKYGYKKMKEMPSFSSIKHSINSREEAISYFQTVPRFCSREWLKIGKNLCDNFINYGYEDWYYWSMSSWGTKWNACETKFNGEETVTFYTKDEVPSGVMKILFEKHADANITWNAKWEDGKYELYNNVSGIAICADGGMDVQLD